MGGLETGFFLENANFFLVVEPPFTVVERRMWIEEVRLDIV